MSLDWKPHTVTVETIAHAPGGTPTYADAVTVTGQITPKQMTAAFNALGVEIERPSKFLMDLGDETPFTTNSRLTFGVRKFYVAAPWRRHEAQDTSDHSSVWLREVMVW